MTDTPALNDYFPNLDSKISAFKNDILQWMFFFWITQLFATFYLFLFFLE